MQQNLIDALLFRQRFRQLFLQFAIDIESNQLRTFWSLDFARNPKAALRVAKEARTMAQKNSDKRAEAMPGPERYYGITSVDLAKSLICFLNATSSIWVFPKIGVPPNHEF